MLPRNNRAELGVHGKGNCRVNPFPKLPEELVQHASQEPKGLSTVVTRVWMGQNQLFHKNVWGQLKTFALHYLLCCSNLEGLFRRCGVGWVITTKVVERGEESLAELWAGVDTCNGQGNHPITWDIVEEELSLSQGHLGLVLFSHLKNHQFLYSFESKTYLCQN